MQSEFPCDILVMTQTSISKVRLSPSINNFILW